MDVFEEYYDKNNLDENSSYSQLSKKQLVIEAEYMNNRLHDILKYLENGGTDLNVVKGKVMDGIYESRI
ncbi:hypothetical protein SAV58_002855 [Enterococcus faecalis]|jgi:hypothetical protein|uniref:hypothetical protein n=1 Tax=Enterococcus TaxID=1350 RepID=UPI00288CE184|nr:MULTISPECIES: hypothetical protein [Enterococcus]ELT9091134.1 hypothetical protein [Enterococcus faecalis]MDT2030239.1 hypothetical protein [Enterococcus faecalis]MDT2387729.1 hypothetical protein [Enterococcus avium]MDT2635860.1 hypothetical protein [Enterococcus dongliensis]MDT2987804.1 hypothetical protein [Enterococcus casseliflavus]